MTATRRVTLLGRVLADALPVMTARLLGAAANLVVLLVMVRTVAPERVGLFHFLATLWALVAVFVDLGGDTMATREMARRPEAAAEILGDFLALKRRLALVGGALFALVVILLVPTAPWRGLCLLTLPVLVGHYAGSFTALFRVRHRLLPPAVAWTLGQGVYVAVALAGLYGAATEVGRFAWLVVAFTAGLVLGGGLIGLWGLRLGVAPRRGRGAGAFLRRCWPQGVAAFAGILYFYLDTVLLQALRGEVATGTYGLAYRVLNVLVYGATALAAAALPLLSRAAARGRMLPLLGDLLGASLFLGGGVAAVGAALPGPCLGWLYGPGLARFPGAAAVLQVLLLACFVLYGGAVLSGGLVAAASPRRWAAVALAGAGLNATLNLVLIPRWGPLGAAWATVATEGAVLLGTLIQLRRAGIGLPVRPPLVALAGAGLAGFAAARLAAPLGFPAAAGLGGAAYAAAARLFGALPRGILQRAVEDYAT